MENVQTELSELKELSEKFQEIAEDRIFRICENLKYQDGSRFSYNIDRLRNFIIELNAFEILDK